MIHPAADLLDRYAAGEFILEQRLTALEKHLDGFPICQNRVIVVEVCYRFERFFARSSALRQ